MRNKLFLLFAGGVAAAALALPATAAADGCPPPEVGTPPYCTPPKPSNKFNLGKVKHPQTGVVTLRVKVSSGGTFTATGKWMRKARAEGEAAGSFTLKLKLNKRGMKKLRESKGRQLRIRVRFTFSPTGGTPRTKYKKLIFRVVHKKPKKK